MPARPRRPLIVRLTVLVVALALSTLALPFTGAAASGFVPLNGSGSSWAYPAIDKWSTDIAASSQIKINFSPSGSAAGRNAYMEDQADFAASDIAFLTTADPFGGGTETPSAAYSYIPIVAGGTSFLYNLKVGTRKITDLRLSGDTLTKIFTGQITNWDDPRITANYGTALPSQHITVVTRADGSGASYELSEYFNTVYGSQWHAFCVARGGKAPCGPTEFYPGFTGSVQRNGSDQVADYISSPSIGEGSIGYDEYSYALLSDIPVVKMLNSAGYYNAPTQYNVAIALQAAKVNNDPTSVNYLIEDLSKVYTNPDPRTYPLSSYSYLIVPRNSRIINGNTEGPPANFNTAKGATLSTWLNYVLCGAQQSAGSLGYSPLPQNLVAGGFAQDTQIPGAVAPPNYTSYTTCNNPTNTAGHVNLLLKNAPFPSKCDYKVRPTSCTAPVAAAVAGSGSTSSSSSRTGSNSVASGTRAAGTTATGVAAAAGATAAGGAVDPDTGQALGSGAATGSEGTAYAAAVTIGNRSNGDLGFAILTTLEILGAIAIPTALGASLARRSRARPTP